MVAVAKRRFLDQVDMNDHEKKNLQILDAIRKKGPITRAEISRFIGLNIVTVTSYVDQYIKKNVIQEVGIEVSSGGRKPTLVDFSPNTVFLIGVGLNISDMVAVLCSPKGDIVYSVKKERPPASGEELVVTMMSLVEELLQKSKADPDKVHGIGIGIPGIFNRETNSVRWSAGLLQDDFQITVSIHSLFEEKFGIPTIVDNDANAAVFGEEWYGKGSGAQHAIYLHSAYGCGILIHGQIYRGSTGSAGEWLFEYEKESSSNDAALVTRPGSWGMDLGIVSSAHAAQKDHGTSQIYALCENDPHRINFMTVVKAAEAGDMLANRLLREAGQRLGRKAAFLVNLFNPDVLIVGGGLEAAGAPFLDGVREQVKNIAIPEATDRLRVVPSTLGENSVPLGAAAFLAQNYFISI